jgi:hypothetical protein
MAYKVTGIRVRLDVIVPPALAEELAQTERAIEAEYAAEHRGDHPGEHRHFS